MTSTLNLHKFINIQYFQNLIRIILDLFIINKKKIFVFFTARITAVVLPAAEHLKFRGYRFEKKLQQIFLYTLRYVQ